MSVPVLGIDVIQRVLDYYSQSSVEVQIEIMEASHTLSLQLVLDYAFYVLLRILSMLLRSLSVLLLSIRVWEGRFLSQHIRNREDFVKQLELLLRYLPVSLCDALTIEFL